MGQLSVLASMEKPSGSAVTRSVWFMNTTVLGETPANSAPPRAWSTVWPYSLTSACSTVPPALWASSCMP